MLRNLINLAAVGLCAWLIVGCVATGSDSKSQVPNLAPATITYPETESATTNQFLRSDPFKKYDSAIVKAIAKKWFDILDTKEFGSNETGKVVVQLHLNPDGTVSDIKILENHAGQLSGTACEQAITGCSPFDRWPPDTKKMDGRDYLEINFTFYYD